MQAWKYMNSNWKILGSQEALTRMDDYSIGLRNGFELLNIGWIMVLVSEILSKVASEISSHKIFKKFKNFGIELYYALLIKYNNYNHASNIQVLFKNFEANIN